MSCWAGSIASILLPSLILVVLFVYLILSKRREGDEPRVPHGRPVVHWRLENVMREVGPHAEVETKEAARLAEFGYRFSMTSNGAVRSSCVAPALCALGSIPTLPLWSARLVPFSGASLVCRRQTPLCSSSR